LGGKKEPSLVLTVENFRQNYGATYRTPEYVSLVLSVGAGLKEISGIKMIIFQEVEQISVQGVGTTLGCRYELATRSSPIFGAV
jgi:hypothetical protein